MPGETASVFLPSVPVLLGLAENMEKQRDHVLGGEKNPDKEGWDDELLEDANQKKTEPDMLEPSYESLGAEAEFSGLLYNGSQFTTGNITDEEEDFLGIPGLLDADQVKDLLRKKQSEELDRREAEEKARRAAEAAEEQRRKLYGTPHAPKRGAEASASSAGSQPGVVDEISALRKELNTVVSITAQRTGRPHGAIHTEARKACGGPPTALCDAEQLRERIDYLRKW